MQTSGEFRDDGLGPRLPFVWTPGDNVYKIVGNIHCQIGKNVQVIGARSTSDPWFRGDLAPDTSTRRFALDYAGELAHAS